MELCNGNFVHNKEAKESVPIVMKGGGMELSFHSYVTYGERILNRLVVDKVRIRKREAGE